MIVLSDRVVLCTPRSGSRSVSAALSPVGKKYHLHHAPIDAVLAENLPTISLLRNPAHILLSFWSSSPKRSFEEFIERGFSGIFGERRVYPYHSVTNEYYPFDKIDTFLSYLGYPELEMPKLGVRSPDTSYADQCMDLVARHFPQDMEVYAKTR